MSRTVSTRLRDGKWTSPTRYWITAIPTGEFERRSVGGTMVFLAKSRTGRTVWALTLPVAKGWHRGRISATSRTTLRSTPSLSTSTAIRRTRLNARRWT
ncbi:putative DNA endonuclease [Ralstonia phage RSJ5]|uniref:Putative DNA endonuclease n=1 Tax=Ralstonia phage RSJ5 TaxID=1538364 RepID=A0A077KYJ5_9CAUD|nr:putative DNA endonuclease [Ralstonia phage RSJ5]BAP34914.1 putative DNA endonuclease [Ralstonia phage RSJ5]